jgi:hypothetical protein
MIFKGIFMYHISSLLFDKKKTAIALFLSTSRNFTDLPAALPALCILAFLIGHGAGGLAS